MEASLHVQEELQGDKTAALRDYLAAAYHHRKRLLLCFSVALLATLLLAVLLPPHWRSAGTILIEQQEMPQELVRSTITSYADERVQVITKRVMTTETLLGIINRYNLYPDQRGKETREALLKRMHKDIGLKMISADVIDPRSGHPTSATIAFEVAFTGDTPDQAAKVANELTTLYLNENLTHRTQLARDAATFLESEGDRLNQRIAELDVQLGAFKKKHYQQLPEVMQLNMTLLDRTEEELRAQQARHDSLEQQRVFLQAQLAQLRPNSVAFSDSGERILTTADRFKMLKSQLAAARARYSPDHPDVIQLQQEVDGLDKDPDAHLPGSASALHTTLSNDLQRNLQRARAELAQAREKYGAEHPDRMRLEREVSSLEAQVAKEPAATTTALADSMVPPVEADNPAYVQIQAQLSATINDLKASDSEAAKLRAKVEEYQRDVRLAPQVDEEYRELTRDYDNTRLKYQELRSKQTEAKMSQNLEADRKGERFTLIDPPLPPEEPASPNRVLIIIGGFILSTGITFALLWLLETLDSSVRGRGDLLRLTGLPPLVLVPHIGTAADARAARRRRWLTFAGATATGLSALALIHFFYRPLDVLWFSAARRFGF